MDLAEPLLSMDEGFAQDQAKDLLVREGREFLGIRRDGRVVGYVTLNDLEEFNDFQDVHTFHADSVLSDTSSFSEVLKLLKVHDSVFVTVFGEPSCLVARKHIEKAPMRMWLFGLISLAEMNLSWGIQAIYPEETWVEQITTGRLTKAKSMQEERERIGANSDLFGCLQFSDKLQILLKEYKHREILGMESRREVDRLIKKLGALRNNSAHAQPLLDSNWETISNLSQAVERIVCASTMKALVAASTKD